MKIKRHHIAIVAAAALVAASGAGYAALQQAPSTQTTVVSALPHFGRVGLSVMYPDPGKTPGATNPAITQDTVAQTICNSNWKTGTVRDTQSTPAQKATTYQTYGITHPQNNVGANQQCELDHLISLELGGADSLDNIWPECGPDGVTLNQRYFKEKDKVENYLHAQVCSGSLTLQQAQSSVVNDWYLVYLKITNQPIPPSTSDN